MSAWIKKEKDLRDDPRVARMARELASRWCVTDSNGGALLGALQLWRTVVLGALDQLWMHGDSFARADDTLETTVEELDALVGIPGFCALLPADWLTQDIVGTVKLVDFGSKNSPEAKRAALNARRQAQHRARGESNAESNAPALRGALPDRQTDRPKTEETRARAPLATRIPPAFALTPEREAIALEHQVEPRRTFQKFGMYWQQDQGPTAIKRDWDKAWRQWCERERPDARGNGSKPKPAPAEEAAAVADLERRKALSRAQSPVAVPVGPPLPSTR